MINPDLDLWRSVLLMGLHDAAKGQDTEWIDSPDFEAVCDLAGFDAQAVRERFQPDLFKRFRRAA